MVRKRRLPSLEKSCRQVRPESSFTCGRSGRKTDVSAVPGNPKTGFPESQMDAEKDQVDGFHVSLEGRMNQLNVFFFS